MTAMALAKAVLFSSLPLWEGVAGAASVVVEALAAVVLVEAAEVALEAVALEAVGKYRNKKTKTTDCQN